MSSAEKGAIERCHDALVREIQITPEFLKYFMRFDLLDEITKDKILNIQTPSQQTEFFLHYVVAKKHYAIPILIHRLKLERKTTNLANNLEHAYELAKNDRKFKTHEKDKRVQTRLFEELNNFYLLLYGSRSWKTETQTLDFHVKKCKMAVNALRRMKESLEEKYGTADCFLDMVKLVLNEKGEHEKWYRQLETTEQEIVDLRADYRRRHLTLQETVKRREEEISKLRQENDRMKDKIKLLARYTYKSELLVDIPVE